MTQPQPWHCDDTAAVAEMGGHSRSRGDAPTQHQSRRSVGTFSAAEMRRHYAIRRAMWSYTRAQYQKNKRLSCNMYSCSIEFDRNTTQYRPMLAVMRQQEKKMVGESAHFCFLGGWFCACTNSTANIHPKKYSKIFILIFPYGNIRIKNLHFYYNMSIWKY